MEKRKRMALWAVRLGLVALAVVMIAVGALQGGYQQVMQKAVRICLECIGIG